MPSLPVPLSLGGLIGKIFNGRQTFHNLRGDTIRTRKSASILPSMSRTKSPEAADPSSERSTSGVVLEDLHYIGLLAVPE
jgi:hypothetical protein